MSKQIETVRERRTIALPIELRAKKESSPDVVSGYAALFYDSKDPGTQYQLWSGCFERIQPGAFDSALKRPDDVRCLFNHDPNQILGRSLSETLTLKVDSKGLYFECQLPNSPAGQTVREAIARGDVSGCSFSFDVLVATWTEANSGADEINYRDILDVALYDVGPVTFPAYVSTEIEVNSVKRSLEQFRAEQRPTKRESRRRRLRLS